MPRVGITSKEVFEAAKILAAQSQIPTQETVRTYLGRGSKGTIHKYLKQWKQSCFKQVQPKGDLVEPAIGLIEEKNTLIQCLEQQKMKLEYYTKELISAEKRLLSLQEQNQQLIAEKEKLQEELKETAASKNSFEKLYEEIKAERGIMKHSLLNEKDRQIEALRQELRESHRHSLEQIKDLGYAGDEALIQEKVKVVQLEDKLGGLSKKVKSLEAELQMARDKYQPLIQQIQQQKGFIQKVVTWEQMQEYEAMMNKG